MKGSLSARTLAFVATICCAFICSQASAETRPAHAPQEALEHYERGRELYSQGHYQEAADELETALALDPTSPNLVYNVAHIRELLNDFPRAIAGYRRYLQLLGRGHSHEEERHRVEATISRLEGAEARAQAEAAAEAERARLAAAEAAAHPQAVAVNSEHEAPATAPSAALATAPATRRVHGVADAAFWVFATLGVLDLAGAGAVGYFTYRTGLRATNFHVGADGTFDDRQRIVDQSHQYALTTDIMIGTGAGLLVTGLLLYALRTKDAPLAATPSHAMVHVEISPHGALLSVGGVL